MPSQFCSNHSTKNRCLMRLAALSLFQQEIRLAYRTRLRSIGLGPPGVGPGPQRTLWLVAPERKSAARC